MKKKIYRFTMLTIMGTAMALMMAGCGKDNNDNTAKESTEQTDNKETDDKEDKNINLDTQEIADAILEGGEFKDSLATVAKEMALGRLYALDAAQIDSAAFYTNSNATAEEIAVIKTTSADYVATVKEAYEKRVSDQKVACENYLPDEMPKLESAVIYTQGNYVILCVSENSDKAESIIKDLFE